MEHAAVGPMPSMPVAGRAPALLTRSAQALDQIETDRALMQRLVARDVAALEHLYDRHSQVALGLACKIVRDQCVAEDVVQDAFLTLWRQPERFDPSRGTARGWLLAIVHHRSIDRLRRAKTSGRTIDLSARLVDEREPDPCERAAQSAESEQLRQALDRLPPEQRHAIELAYLHGHTHSEIAKLMNCPLGTVKGRIRIGLSKLRAMTQVVELALAAGVAR